MHGLILGMTESGKTTLAKRLIKDFQGRGIKSIVLDPLCDPAFGADFQTSDEDEFMRTVFSSRHCLVIVDESGDAIGRYNKPMFKLATRGRHWGHICLFISQRGADIAKTIRDNTGALYLFCSSKYDGKLLASEYNDDELLNCSTLQRGEFYYTTRFGPCIKKKLF